MAQKASNMDVALPLHSDIVDNFDEENLNFSSSGNYFVLFRWQLLVAVLPEEQNWV